MNRWLGKEVIPWHHPRYAANPFPISTQGHSHEDLTPLLDRVRQRDEAAARTLVKRVQPIVAKVVASHLPRRDEPEDLYQEIYMKVFSKIGQYRGDAPLEHWVARIARTTCFDRLRRQKARPEWRRSDLTEQERAVFDRAEGDTSNEVAVEAARSLVDRILSHMPPQDAWLIRSVDLDEMPFEEICAAMDWNNSVGRVRLFRARKKLKKVIKEIERQADQSS